MVFCDAHVHLSAVGELGDIGSFLGEFGADSYCVCTSIHTDVEYKRIEMMFGKEGSVPSERISLQNEGSVPSEHTDLQNKRSVPLKLVKSFGILPQNPDKAGLETLKTLLKTNSIDAVGECGFDFFTKEYSANRENQIICFEKQAELAAEYGKPLVIHNRKALEMIYAYRQLLCSVPSVIFHSFAFGPKEAESIVSKGINAYFSLGKQLLNGNKKALQCAENIPPERLLLETDAPYQTLKGEQFTRLSDIRSVYEKTSEIKKIELNELCEEIKNNFLKAYGLY